MHLLFPGRHLLNTRFQEDYLTEAIGDGTIDTIVFAITSKSHGHSRYHPIPYDERVVGVDRFGRDLKRRAKRERGINLEYRIFGIPDFPHTDRFAEMILKEIEHQTEGALILTPENTEVLCSTPNVIGMYSKLGFAILPAELISLNPEEYRAETPIHLIKRIAELGENWQMDKGLRRKLSRAAFEWLNDNPQIARRIARLYNDSLLTDDGNLTAARNYDAYAFGMGNNDIIDIKYNDIKDFIMSGVIADEGCASGDLLMRIAKDFPDSDLIGVEASGEFIERFEENKRAGRFGQAYVYAHQRNIMERIFKDTSIDTTLSLSALHEIWSYGSQKESLGQYLANKFR